MSVALSCGLYVSHVFIPPTPGPIAAASTLGIGDNLLMVMGIGALCSVLPLIAGYFFAKYIGKKVKADDEANCNDVKKSYDGYFFAKYIGKKVKADDEANCNDVKKSYEELVAEYGKLPNGFVALAPILVPILLMAASSIASMAGWSGAANDILKFLGTPIIALAVGTIFGVIQLVGAQLLMAASSIASMAGWSGAANDILKFLGTPIIALAVGTIFGVIQLVGAQRIDKFYNLTNETLKTVGPILFVTAAGGVLGKVIASTSMIEYITQNAELLETIGIFFPFILAAILKSAQGSSTVALTTTAGIVAPILPVLGLDSPIRATLAVMAIGAGAMTVSHANESYFWVVTNFGAMTPEKGYKTQTMATLVLGIAGMIEIFVLSLFLH